MRRADRCPGVLRPHRAEDGALVRLRFPGGRTTGTTLLALGALASAYGQPDLHLTSRAGLQIRGLPESLPTEFVARVESLGLLPSPAHERVRNIVASPLTGISGGAADLGPLVTALDRALLADPTLADLPGRFLFVLDDGRGDVANLTFDLGYRALSPSAGLLLVGSTGRGVPVSAAEAAAALVRLAAGFAAERGDVWHVRDLPDWVASQTRDAVPALPLGPAEVPLGVVADAASVQVPLGRLTPAQLEPVAAAVGDQAVVLTPWRGLVLPGAAYALPFLVASGLVADQTSAWSLLSACVGAPGCGRARVDTTAWARQLVGSAAVEGRTHLSGCGRRCGAPGGSHVDLVA